MVKNKFLEPVSSFVLTKEQQVIYTIGYQGHYEYWYGVREHVSMIFPIAVQSKQEIQRVVDARGVLFSEYPEAHSWCNSFLKGKPIAKTINGDKIYSPNPQEVKWRVDSGWEITTTSAPPDITVQTTIHDEGGKLLVELYHRQDTPKG